MTTNKLSKYFWAVSSFRGILSANTFVKRYELHYQLKRVQIGGDVVYA
jgi:hypothetical protein